MYCTLVINYCSVSYSQGSACVMSTSLLRKHNPAGSESQRHEIGGVCVTGRKAARKLW